MPFNPAALTARTLKQFVSRLHRLRQSQPQPAQWPPKRTQIQEDVAIMLGFASWHAALRALGDGQQFTSNASSEGSHQTPPPVATPTSPSRPPHPEIGAPTALEARLPPRIVLKFANSPSRPTGLVVVSGVAGSGKNAFLKDFLDHTFKTDDRQKVYMIGVEDDLPVDTGQWNDGNIIKRRPILHRDQSSQQLLSAVTRRPTAVVLGESPDPEAMAEVITTSMTGHRTYTTSRAAGIVELAAWYITSAPRHSWRTLAIDLLSCAILHVGIKLVQDPDGKLTSIYETLLLSNEQIDHLVSLDLVDLPAEMWKIMDHAHSGFVHDAHWRVSQGLLSPQAVKDMVADQALHRKQFLDRWRAQF